MSIPEGGEEKKASANKKGCDKKKKEKVEEEARKWGDPVLRCRVALPCHSDL